jgi:hypothetical protein
MRSRSLLFVLVVTLLGSDLPTGGASLARADWEPFKATVQGPLVLTCANERGMVQAFITNRNDGKPIHTVNCIFVLQAPIRWQVGHGAFWVASGGTGIFRGHPLREGADQLDRFQLADLWKGKALSAPDTESHGSGPLFALLTPARQAREWGRSSEFDFRVHCDYLPTGPFQIRQFVLTNTRGRLVPTREAGSVAGYRSEQTAEEKEKPVWSFTVHEYQAKWDAREKSWLGKPWRREATLPVAFREPFFALASGDDWYFLTVSGRLFHAPPASRGGERKLVAVWDDPRRPIEGQIQDSSGRTFLFVSAAGKGKPACFELSAKPKLVEYDPDRVPYLDLEEPLYTVLHRVAVLEKLKLLPPAR